MASPGYANEKKVDHLALILEVCFFCFSDKGGLHQLTNINVLFLAIYQVIRAVQDIQSR